jgi:hypothetical protein
MKLIPFTLLLLLLFIASPKLIGCQCTKVSYRFTDKISQAAFVGLVEVIGKDTVRSNNRWYSFTKVKIVAQYNGKYIGKEAKIIDGHGYECITRLENDSIGAKWVIKAGISKVYEWIYSDGLSKEEEVLTLGICSENTLEVKDGMVIGNITRNQFQSRWRWDRFLKKVSFGLIDRDDQRKWSDRKLQQMSFDQFHSFMQNTFG